MNSHKKVTLDYTTSNRAVWLQTVFNCQVDDIDHTDDQISEYAAERVFETIAKIRKMEELVS